MRHHDQSDEINENEKCLVPLCGTPSEIPALFKRNREKRHPGGYHFEFKVTSPDGQELVTNMRLSSEDIELWKEISEAMR